ncbi:MAG: hypothetical protein DMF53_28640, partial [Acidobacteria bacterium]
MSRSTRTGFPPPAGTVQRARALPVSIPQYAMLWPWGDQLGCTASPSVSRRLPPEATSTRQISLF